MIVFITALISFLSSLAPLVLQYFQRRQEMQYNAQIKAMELEAILRKLDVAQAIAAMRADVADTANARASDDDTTTWVGWLRAIVRPIITIAFGVLFFGFKSLQISILLKTGLSIDNLEAAGKIILDESTMIMIMAIISFYFGGRLVDKLGSIRK